MAQLAATYVIDPDHRGLYEQPLDGGTTVEVTVTGIPYVDVTFAHHGGTTPLYLGDNPDVQPRDQTADIVFVDGTMDRSFNHTDAVTFWLTSEADIVFSVTRIPHDG